MALTVVKAPGNIINASANNLASLKIGFENVFYIPNGTEFIFENSSGNIVVPITSPNPLGYTDKDDYVLSIIFPKINAILSNQYNLTFIPAGSNDNSYISIVAKNVGPQFNLEFKNEPVLIGEIVGSLNDQYTRVFTEETVLADYVNMAVTIKNPVEYVVNSNEVYISTGVKHRFKLQFTSLQPANSQLIFNLLGQIITFTFKLSANPEYLEIRTFSTSIGLADWVANYIIPAILKNYLIAVNYKLWSVGNELFIEAKEPGTKYIAMLTLPNSQIIHTVIAAGVNEVKRPNFETLIDVYLEKEYMSENFELVYSASAIPNNGSCRFNLSMQLQSLLKPLILFPDFNTLTDGGTFRAISPKRYSLKMAEMYGAPQAVNSYENFANFSPITALFGGFKRLNFIDDGLVYHYFNAEVNKFLTSIPNNTELHKDQLQFLSFYLNKANGLYLMKIRLKLYYDDGTSSNAIDSITFSDTKNCIITVPVGYDQLAIDSLKASGKNVNKYDVWISNNSNTAITETKTFFVNNDYYRHNRFFAYLNAFGVAETIWFTGNLNHNVMHDNQMVERIYYRDDEAVTSVYDGDLIEFDNTAKQSFTLSTGYKTKEWNDYAQQFINSHLKYAILTDKLAAINIDKTTVEVYNDTDTEFGFAFTYTFAWQEEGLA